MRKIRANTQVGRPFPKGNPGKPPGARNKIGKTTKENYDDIFSGTGGVPYAVYFLLTHPKAYEKFLTETYARCMPLDVNHGGQINSVIHFDYSNGNGNGHA
jgi:hypothetical protein